MSLHLIRFLYCFVVALVPASLIAAEQRPHIVLVMADDMGWGQTGYYNHPILKTPHLDAMAANGLRLDRFYAGAPVCSPTRASVLTGRNNMRTGVDSHGFALRLQEQTIAQALQQAGYATGHFGKWHLNGMRGPGAPIFADDPYRPDVFGFETWFSVTNFFDMDPILSRQGDFEEYQGDSSEIVIEETLEFIEKQVRAGKPSFSVVWYGTPHSPFRAYEKDMEPFAELNESSRQHYGELVAMDRSIGTLRDGLNKLGVAENTLFWFCSDNGGLPGIKPETVGGLRGNKGTVYEGGLRVPCVIEWPAKIEASRITEFPAATMDIFPTIADLLDLPESALLQPQDGISLAGLLQGEEWTQRAQPLGFWCLGNQALIDNNLKMLYVTKKNKKSAKMVIEFYDLANDPTETKNLYDPQNENAVAIQKMLDDWIASVERSIAGEDYPEGKLDPPTPDPIFWTETEQYKPYLKSWYNRPEYKRYIDRVWNKK